MTDTKTPSAPAPVENVKPVKAAKPRPVKAPEAANTAKVKVAKAKVASVKPAAKPTAKSAAPAPAAEPAVPKQKLVRDSFTIPKAEYAVLDALKARAANLKRPVKKGELIRAGIGALNAMADKAFLAALDGVPSLKTGRPKGDGEPARKVKNPGK